MAMPDIGFMELLVIGIVALIVVGPKDLPVMFRKAGQAMGNVRAMARQFTRAMEDAAGESGMKDISRDLRNITNPRKMGMDAINKAFDDIDPTKFAEGSETRRLAEEKAAAQKAARTVATARRTEAEARIKTAKGTAAPPAPVVAPEPSPPAPAAATPAPVKTGAKAGAKAGIKVGVKTRAQTSTKAGTKAGADTGTDRP
jgi:sec-independent protein translocase protein TatB